MSGRAASAFTQRAKNREAGMAVKEDWFTGVTIGGNRLLLNSFGSDEARAVQDAQDEVAAPSVTIMPILRRATSYLAR